MVEGHQFEAGIVQIAGQRVVGKAEAQMRMLGAQEFQLVRRKVDGRPEFRRVDGGLARELCALAGREVDVECLDGWTGRRRRWAGACCAGGSRRR